MPNPDLKELENTHSRLLSHLEKIDQNAIRDKKGDYKLKPKNEISQIMQSQIKDRKKLQLINTEIGYIRCNLFSEYYERIKLAEEKNELKKAANLMNEYAKIAIPFVTPKKPPLSQRIMSHLGRNHPKSPDHVQNWKETYESWLKTQETTEVSLNAQNSAKEFAPLKIAFFKLYTYSFSINNFPPLRERRTDR